MACLKLNRLRRQVQSEWRREGAAELAPRASAKSICRQAGGFASSRIHAHGRPQTACGAYSVEPCQVGTRSSLREAHTVCTWAYCTLSLGIPFLPVTCFLLGSSSSTD